MILPIKDAFQKIAEAIARLDGAEKKLLQYIHPFKDPKFEFSAGLEPYVYDGARRLFERRFLYAFQLANDGYREIGFLDWDDPVTAYLMLYDGFYVNKSIYHGSIDREPYPIFVHDYILADNELKKMLKVMLAYCQPLGDRTSIFDNLGDSVAGKFEPADPGIPKWGIRLCDGYKEYTERRFFDHQDQENIVRPINLLVADKWDQKFVVDRLFGSEALRRASLASHELKLALAKSDLAVFVRSNNFSDPISIPSVIWWVTNNFSDATEHQVLHMEPEERLSSYNGAAPFLERQEFQTWLDNHNLLTATPKLAGKRRAGRHKGKASFPEDQMHIERIKGLIDDEKAPTFAAAFRMIEEDVSGASSDAKRRRLQGKYKGRYMNKNGN